MARKRIGSSQAWVELLAQDIEAVSAFTVAKARIAAALRLKNLRRFRFFELSGPLPSRAEQEDLLHRSTQFYNPHKERCALRMTAGDPAPLLPGERAVLVVEREGVRRTAAERWWRHETGDDVEVREGTTWGLILDDGAAGEIEDLALVRERRHGLLCNPHSQDCRLAGDVVPLPWLGEPARPAARPRATRSRE